MSMFQASQTQDQPTVLDIIEERRSVRSYDPEVTIPRDELIELLRVAALAPSAANLQPWRFLVIDSAELKQKLLPIANNQQQVIEASAVIAVLGDLESIRQVDKIYNQAAEAGFMSEETANSFIERYKDLYSNFAPEALRQIVYTDCGLVSMQLMLAARGKGYDTVAMGGFDHARLREAFAIPDPYASTMLIAIGKAVKPGQPTVRLPIEEVVFFDEVG